MNWRYRNCIIICRLISVDPLPLTCISFPIVNIPHQSGGLLQLTNRRWHLKISRSLWFTSGFTFALCCTFYRFWQICNGLCLWFILIVLRSLPTERTGPEYRDFPPRVPQAELSQLWNRNFSNDTARLQQKFFFLHQFSDEHCQWMNMFTGTVCIVIVFLGTKVQHLCFSIMPTPILSKVKFAQTSLDWPEPWPMPGLQSYLPLF